MKLQLPVVGQASLSGLKLTAIYGSAKPMQKSMVRESEGTVLKEVTIYTDGGAIPNPGKGGYEVVLRFGKHVKELSGGYALTTNNRMELMAVITGLEALKERCRVQLHSDSKYIVDAISTGSAFKWRDNNWSMKASGSKKVKNPADDSPARCC